MYFRKFAALLSSASLLGACAAGPPDFTSESELPVHFLTEQINCEMYEAVDFQLNTRKRTWMKNWQGVYTITLKTTETSGLSAASNTFPFVLTKSASKLTLGAGAGAKQTATRTGVISFNLNFADVSKGFLQKQRCPIQDARFQNPLVRGRIGFADWMDRALETSDSDIARRPSVGPDTITSIGHTFEFSIDVNGSVSPTFVLAPAPVTLTPSGSLDRLDDNSVQVAFAKPVAKQASVTKVELVQTAEQKKQQVEDEAALQRLNDQLEAIGNGIKRSKIEKDAAATQYNEIKSKGLSSFLKDHPDILGKFDAAGAQKSFDAKLDTLAIQKNNEESSIEEQNQMSGRVIAAIAEKKDDIARAKSPRGTRTTTVTSTNAGGFYPAEQNPYISQTQLQLLFQQRPLQNP